MVRQRSGEGFLPDVQAHTDLLTGACESFQALTASPLREPPKADDDTGASSIRASSRPESEFGLPAVILIDRMVRVTPRGSGFVRARADGEISLERLQKASEARVAESGRKIANHYDLSVHLLSRATKLTGELISESGLGRVDLLF